MEYINTKFRQNTKLAKLGPSQTTTMRENKTYQKTNKFTLSILLICLLQIPTQVLTAALPSEGQLHFWKDFAENEWLKLHLYGQGKSELSPRRKHRRHHELPFFQIRHHSISEWMNPCGGIYNPQELEIMPEEQSSEVFMNFMPKPRVSRQKIKPYLRLLRRSIRDQYNLLQGMHRSIDISEFSQWQKWTNRYDFLPRIERNSTIKLRKWYRDMQKYIGAFGYLGRKWYDYDVKNQVRRDATNELHALLISARSILCEIETAINGSNAVSGVLFQNRLPVYTQSVMNDKFNFLSRIDETNELQVIDLIFLKKYYMDYLDAMNGILYKFLRNSRSPVHTYETFSEQVEDTTAEDISQSLSGIMGSESTETDENLHV